MKIVVTGASGFIGQQLIPHLHAQGHDLVVLGRDPARLTHLFGSAYPAYDFDTMDAALAGCDAVVHLAVLNTTASDSASSADYHTANVDLVARLVAAARSAGVRKIINFDTFQSGSDTNIYAKTKAEGAALLAGQSDIEVVQIKLPIVYGARYTGKLTRLNNLPGPSRAPMRHLLSLAKPVVHIDRVAAAVSQELIRSPGANRVRFVSDGQHDNWAYAITKWIVDFGFALTIIALLWWLLIGAWIAVKATSLGPGIFTQTRVGRNNAPFTLYKFRTMALGTAQSGTHEVSANSVTRVGGFLRKTKIDELPQILNILKGEMSLVGYRPCLPSQTELIAARDLRNVSQTRSGITGLAQVQNIDMSTTERLAQVDAEYIARRTLIFDLILILRTVSGAGQGDAIKDQG